MYFFQPNSHYLFFQPVDQNNENNFRSFRQLGDLRPNLIQETQITEGIGGFNSQGVAQIRDNQLNQLESTGSYFQDNFLVAR